MNTAIFTQGQEHMARRDISEKDIPISRDADANLILCDHDLCQAVSQSSTCLATIY